MGRPSPYVGRDRVMRYAACYLIWLLIILIGYVVIAIVWRTALQSVLVAVFDETDVDDRYRSGAFYFFSITAFMVGLFAMVMAGEPYLRGGAERGLLVKRATKLVVPLLAFGALGLVVRLVAEAAA